MPVEAPVRYFILYDSIQDASFRYQVSFVYGDWGQGVLYVSLCPSVLRKWQDVKGKVCSHDVFDNSMFGACVSFFLAMTFTIRQIATP